MLGQTVPLKSGCSGVAFQKNYQGTSFGFNMSGEKTASPCNKFQANIFNKSKCQNCFKSRELHLLSDHDMNQAKPIYGGWLCLAPEGTNFDNPMQRSRKWQRRFFILYEHGSLSFALDELPSTLPQGTVNMNLCTEVVDAEPRTGQRNALLLVTPEQEFFIRGENKDIINGWSEQLTVYPQTNQQNPKKKKRRVQTASFQEPSPAKMAATESGSPPALRGAAESGSGLRQEELPGGVTEVDRVWTVTGTGPLNPHETPADNVSQYLPSAPRERSSFNGGLLSCSSCISSSLSSLDSEASGSSDSGSDQQPAPNNSHTIKQRAADRGCYKDTGTPNMVHSGRTEAGEKVEQVWSRTGRAEGRSSQREKLQSCGDIAQLTVPPSQRRSKSLDRRTTESIMTPDLLNFKKGWMVKLDNKDEWTKYWFVLSADSLRYYKDSIAEEASDLQGDIDLTKCYSVSEYQVQRNCGFQIHTQKGVYTLTAMTAGIRKNWIQALMKNVRPSNAPDVTSLPGHIISCSPTEALPKPDVTHDSSTETPSVTDQGPKPSRVREKRHQGRYKTFDWTEFRPLAKPVPELNVQSAKDPFPLDVERKTRREERRKRYEGILGFPLGLEDVGDKGSSRRSPGTKRRVKGEIEQCWLQVENTLFTLDRSVPLCTEALVKQTVELERLLENYRKGVEDLKGQLAESDHQRLELEAQLNAAQDPQQQVLTGTLPLLIDPPLTPESDEGPPKTIPVLSHTQSLRKLYRETQELLQQQDTIRQSMQEQLGLSVRQMLPYHQTQPPSIWLLDTEGNLQELEDLFPGGPVPRNTPALSPVSDSPPLPNDLADEPVLTSKMERGVQQLARSPESHTDPSVWCPDSLITEDTVERNSILGTDSQACWEADRPRPEHVDPNHIPVRTLSDEMVRLTGQNEALERLNQEMLNQLKEADREIDRLKAELLSRHREVNVQPEAACLERELGMRTQELGETQALLASLDQRLMDTEAQLQLKEATLKVLGFPELEAIHKESVYLSHFEVKGEGLQPNGFEDTGAKLWEPERRLRQSEEASTQTEAEMDVDILNKEMNSGRSVEGKDMLCGDNSTSSDDRIQEVVKGIAIRSKVMGKAQEVISRSALKVINSPFQRELEEGKPRVVRHLLWEEEFWGAMWISWKTSPSQVDKDGPLGSILGDVLKHMVMETQMLLLAHSLHSEKAQNTETGRGSQEMLCGSRSLKDLDIIGNIEGETESEMIEGTVEREEKEYVSLNARNTDTVTDRRFTEVTQGKLSLLKQVASHVSTSATDELCSMANRLWDFHSTRRPWLSLVHCAAIQVFSYSQIHFLLDEQQRALDSEPVPHSPSIVCSNCAGLLSENQELRKRLSDLEKLWHSSAGSPMVEQPDIQASKRQDPELKRTAETDIQASELKQAAETDIQDPELKQAAETDIQASELKQAAETDIQDPELKQAAETDIQDSESHGPELKQKAETAGVSDGGIKQDRSTKEEEVGAGTPEEVVVEGDSSSMEIPPLNNTQKIQEKKTCEIIEGRNIVFPDNETEISGKEEVLLLRRRVKDLKEQLSMSMELLAAEHDGRMASLQLQHEKDIGKLKATYECGFVSMEESHQKVLLELQHRHQQHLQRLLSDKDRLLEEEVAATATAIQAIQNAHCLELKKEVQKIRQTSTGNTDLEEVCRQHSEELASCQRELEVLSQQFSLKYLENGHLAQALEAERQALCQCQQENQDLRSRNQELTGHLAAEITRLCSLAKQDITPHNQGIDGYELKITLRVKESELQCLKQEITSIKDELQTAQRDKRFATQKYEDIYTELSILRERLEPTPGKAESGPQGPGKKLSYEHK